MDFLQGFLQGSSSFIFEKVESFGLWFVFFGSVLEEIISPIPSPTLLAAAATTFLREHQSFSLGLVSELLLIAALSAAGKTIGTLVFYYAGFYGGKGLVDRFGKYFGVNWQALMKFEKRFIKGSRDEIILVGLRAFPFAPTVLISLLTGVLRIPLFEFVWTSLVGFTIRATIFLILAWKMTDTYQVWSSGAKSGELIFSVVVVAVGLAVMFWFYHKHHK